MVPRAPYRPLPSEVSGESEIQLEASKGPLATLRRGHSHSAPYKDPRTAKSFKRKCQLYTLVAKLALRWLCTAIFLGSIAGTLWGYQRKQSFSQFQKNIFNTVITALILGLGLNLFEALKETAKVLRWRILAENGHTLRETDLILGFESLLTVGKLMCESYGKLGMIIVCFSWLAINLIAQILVAMITFSYSVADGKTYNDTYFANGMVDASNLTSYFNGLTPLSSENNQAMAHTWGEVSQSNQACGPYEDIAQVYSSLYDPPYFCRRTAGKQEFAYRFKEYNDDDKEKAYPSFTNRVITVSSGACFSYTEIHHTLGPDLFNNIAAWNYTFSNSTYTSSISIPIASEGWSATVYIYRGTELPDIEKENSCGDRCLWIWAHRAAGPNSPQAGTFFQCPITVSEVGNTTMDEQKISDSVARVAAASIALQGRWAGTVQDKIWTQQQFYAYNTPWETHNLPDEQASARMAEFALRSLATMVDVNPTIRLPGPVPQLGSHLEIYKGWRNGLLLGIGAMHLLLALAVAWATKSVVITDDSQVAIARLLSGLTMGFEEKGTLLRGEALCKAITEDRGTRQDDETGHGEEQGGRQAAVGTAFLGDGIVYGPLDSSKMGRDYILHLGTSTKSRGQWARKRHPNGRYL